MVIIVLEIFSNLCFSMLFLREDEMKKKARIKLPTFPLSPIEIAFTCSHFTVTHAYFTELLGHFKGFYRGSLLRELKKMRDWLDKNPRRHKRNDQGMLKNPNAFIRKWLRRIDEVQAPW